MNVTESNDYNTLLLYLTGRPGHDYRPIRHQDAHDAARRLACQAHKRLSAGVGPDDVVLPLPINSDDEAPREETPSAPPPPSYGVEAAPDLARLDPGVVVVRELIRFTEVKLTTEVPCCGRRIAMPVPAQYETAPAQCCLCHVTYQVSVEEEMNGYDDEPFRTAVFTVEHVAAAAAQHRASRWGKR